MKKIILTIIISLFAAALFPVLTLAAPDQYLGDTVVYEATPVQPNVLIILDTSGSMNDLVLPGSPYNPATTYPITNACEGGNKACQSNTVYRCLAFGLDCDNWVAHVTNVSSVATSCPSSSANPYQSLTTTGQWNSSNRRLRTNGTCTSGTGIYAVGNWINWRSQLGGAPRPKIDVAKDVLTNLLNSTNGVRFGVMVFNNNQGGHLLSQNGYTAEIKDMDAIFSGSTTNRQALTTAVNGLNAQNWTPLAETQFEAMRYFQGAQTAFNGSFTYTPPMQASCQKNYVVFITDGMSTQDRDNILKTICNNGDCNGDGHEPANDPAKSYPNNGSDYLDDVAKYMHDTDLSAAFPGIQNVITYTIGFGLGGGDAGAVMLLNETAQNGGGQAFNTNNQPEMISALTLILGKIFEADTSFVAPVVPVSPENRTYSGSRVYLGFFKPQSISAFWYGNLKKYGIDNTGAVVDKNGNPATNSDGSFLDTAVSYWSAAADGGDVDSGGVGEILLNQDFTTNPRKIYTYKGSNLNLTDPSNAFTTSNSGITFTTLAVANNIEKDKLINFVHGRDAYDGDVDGSTSEKRGWILGDILHSRPQVISYASYPFTPTAEADCSMNKTLIYVGSNDGMLHAFKDCDGSEAWSFIPQELLPNLQYLTQVTHTYSVDSSPSVYLYDADKDGNIEMGDKVILLFGERRGGGFYYALDVSDPATPKYLWRLSATESPSGNNSDYAELGQSWSEPEITRVKVGTEIKMVAIIGAGYDHANEDGRYGATQTYDGTGTPSGNGEGVVTSSGTSGPLNPKGRGVYVVEVATLDNFGIPSFSNSGGKVWGHTNANNSALAFSIPSAVTVLDRNLNGYADRLYVGDTGGNIWRLDIGDSSTTNWTGRKIFSSNPGSGGVVDVGRKIFYKPSVILESGYEMMFLGTGDREHPLNEGVVDRLYGVKDKGEATVLVVEDSVDNLHELVDVTTNDLQGASTPSSQITSILSDLSTKYGWYIRLNQNSGEKVLAPAVAFQDVYYTTYAPNTAVVADPCTPASQVTGRLYEVSNKTGEAVQNLDASNDSYNITNTRATNAYGDVLLREDRVMTLGSGIPSGVVMIITAGGDVTALVGCGGSLCNPPPLRHGNTFRVYWKRM